MDRLFLLPGRGLHFLEAAADHHLDIFAAHASRRTAAVHRRVAATEDDDALGDLCGMAECHIGQPVDADVDVRRRFLAPRNVGIATARRAGADEYRIPVAIDQTSRRLLTQWL